MTEQTPTIENRSTPRRGRPPCRVTPEQVADLVGRGVSLRKAARLLGVSKTSFARFRNDTLLVSQNSLDLSQNNQSDPSGVLPGSEAAQPSGEREPEAEVREALVSAPATQSAPAVAPLVLRRIMPDPNPAGDIQPITGKPTGPCKKCGSSVWRRMPGGTFACAVCRPLTGG